MGLQYLDEGMAKPNGWWCSTIHGLGYCVVALDTNVDFLTFDEGIAFVFEASIVSSH